MEPTDPILRILHFNDVYDIQPKPKTGDAGAYHFKAYLDKHRNQNTLTLFSGDAFSPSLLSNIFRGQQMVHCLNTFQIDVACFGNHEFDFDIDYTIELAKDCNFPWLLGNLLDLRTERPLGDGKENIIIEKNGVKIGIFAVAEEEWITLLKEDYQGELEYIDFVKYARYQTDELKRVYKCDIVIALTHMRVPNDQKLAREVPDIDFILGGHDHIVWNEVIERTQCVKTGTNFQHLSVIDIHRKKGGASDKADARRYPCTVQLIPIGKVEDYDQPLKEFVDSQLKIYESMNEKVIGYALVPLQTRFSRIRRKQTNYGNFLTDLIRSFYNIDAVTLQSGTVRIDSLIEPGPLKFSTVSHVIDDYLIVKFIPGKILYNLLEHSVSKYPAFEGRFMMISGIRYTFDASKPPYSRVDKSSILVNGVPLDETHVYKIGMSQYVGQGGDGYTFLADCKDYIDSQVAIKLTVLMSKFYLPSDFDPPKAGKQVDQEYEILAMKKRVSSKTERLHKFIKKMEYFQDRYVPCILPETDGRVVILNEVPDVD